MSLLGDAAMAAVDCREISAEMKRQGWEVAGDAAAKAAKVVDALAAEVLRLESVETTLADDVEYLRNGIRALAREECFHERLRDWQGRLLKVLRGDA